MVSVIEQRTLVMGNLAISISKGALGLLGLIGADILGSTSTALLGIYTAYLFIGLATPFCLWAYANRRPWALGALFAISAMALIVDLVAAIYSPLMLLLAIAPALTIRYLFKHHSIRSD